MGHNQRRRFMLQLAALATSASPLATVVANSTSAWLPEPEESGYIATPQGRIWYRLNGKQHFASGRTPLVCLHGGPGASHHYLLTLLDLAFERPVIFYDQLDCGLSDRPGQKINWTNERFISEIDIVREALNLSTLALYGNSCGSTWIAPYAAKRPAGLKAVIFASPFLAAKPYLHDAQKLRRALPADVLQTMDEHEAAGTIHSEAYHDAVYVWYKRHVCRLDTWPASLLRTVELFNNPLYEHMWGPSEASLTGTLNNFDASDALSKIKVPSWFVCGEHDEMTPATTQAFAALTPNAQFSTIANASHTPHLEQREVFMAAAKTFLNRYADA